LATPLCHKNEITDPGSKGFQIASIDHSSKHSTDIFVVQKDGQYFAYINSCPHTGASLEWQENQFLDMDKSYIQCSTHDALFEIATGRCISGPCAGENLRAIKLSLDNDIIVVDF
jgi:nitrite reductase/ring-hydroxylating ferredoxin subunit